MLKQITKEDVLEAWLIKLRDPNTEQCIVNSELKHKSKGNNCALSYLHNCIPEYIKDNCYQFNLTSAAEYIGLSPKQSWEIIDSNDGKGRPYKTLPEIADMVENMLKT